MAGSGIFIFDLTTSVAHKPSLLAWLFSPFDLASPSMKSLAHTRTKNNFVRIWLYYKICWSLLALFSTTLQFEHAFNRINHRVTQIRWTIHDHNSRRTLKKTRKCFILSMSVVNAKYIKKRPGWAQIKKKHKPFLPQREFQQFRGDELCSR